MAKYLEGTDAQKNRACSPAVITEGGRIVWLAGQTATVDGDGKDISGDFEAQTHRVFALIDQTLRRAGGSLANLVTMTVFIKEPRHGDRFVELRRRKFPDGHYPGSALITVTRRAPDPAPPPLLSPLQGPPRRVVGAGDLAGVGGEALQARLAPGRRGPPL